LIKLIDVDHRFERTPLEHTVATLGPADGIAQQLKRRSVLAVATTSQTSLLAPGMRTNLLPSTVTIRSLSKSRSIKDASAILRNFKISATIWSSAYRIQPKVRHKSRHAPVTPSPLAEGPRSAPYDTSSVSLPWISGTGETT